MRTLAFALGVLTLAGCDDSAMNLGPNSTSSTSTGGSGTPVGGNSATGTPTTYTPPWIAVGGNSGESSVGGASNLGGNLATGGTSIATTAFKGLNLEGLEKFSCEFDNSSLAGWITGTPPCQGTEPAAYRLDLATRTLTHEHCGPSSDGTTAVTQVDSRVLPEAEVTGCMMMLEQVSLNHRNICGTDSPVRTLKLDFGARTETYYHDFTAGCQPKNSEMVFVGDLDGLIQCLERAISNPTPPTNYDAFTIGQPPTSEVGVTMASDCGTGMIRQFEVDLAAKQAVEKDCSWSVRIGETTPSAALRTTPRNLEDATIEYLRSRVAELRFGATRECTDTEFAALAWFNQREGDVAFLVDARGACPGQPEHAAQYTFNLNELYWTVNELFHPIL